MSAAAALMAQAAALRAQADVLEALAATLTDTAGDELLGVAECTKRFGVGRDAIKAAAARGELSVSRGPRQRLLVRRSALVAWLESKPMRGAERAEEWAA